MAQIFSDVGTISAQQTSARDVFIVFKGCDMSDVLVARAPMSSVRIDQQVDYNVTKALGKDFLISAFGDRPVTIVISGMNIYNAKFKAANETQIAQLYAENKLSKDITKRVEVGIAGLNGAATASAFSCAIVSLDIEATSESAIAGTYNYKITLIGSTL